MPTVSYHTVNGRIRSTATPGTYALLLPDGLGNVVQTRPNAAVYRRYYNQQRPHSSLGYRPPAVAAQDWKPARATPLPGFQSSHVRMRRSLRL